jgi:ABC-2 type transport system ATP-binding protein
VDVVAHGSLARRHLGVVSQVNTLDRSLSVGENLYFHCRFFGLSRREAKQRSSDLLESFDLAHRRHERVDRLSGGLAQRAQLARALAHRPSVLFLDEPTAWLDPQSRLALWELIRKLRERERSAVVLTTHSMDEADRLFDRVAIMDHGRILVCDART